MPHDDVRSERVQVGPRRWHVRIAHKGAAPDAPVIVLVHGLVVSSRYMVGLARELARTHRVFAPDLPGFGLSDPPERSLDVFELADALDEWMEAVGLERATFLGNSFGCQTIAHLAVRHPARVEAIVLQGPTNDATRPGFFQQLWGWLKDGFLEPSSELPILLRDYWDAGPRRAIETIGFMRRDRIEALLPRIERPALVVRGARDQICSAEWCDEVRRLLPNGKLLVLPGLAHALNFSAPLELARIVRGFLAEVGTEAHA